MNIDEIPLPPVKDSSNVNKVKIDGKSLTLNNNHKVKSKKKKTNKNDPYTPTFGDRLQLAMACMNEVDSRNFERILNGEYSREEKNYYERKRGFQTEDVNYQSVVPQKTRKTEETDLSKLQSQLLILPPPPPPPLPNFNSSTQKVPPPPPPPNKDLTVSTQPEHIRVYAEKATNYLKQLESTLQQMNRVYKNAYQNTKQKSSVNNTKQESVEKNTNKNDVVDKEKPNTNNNVPVKPNAAVRSHRTRSNSFLEFDQLSSITSHGSPFDSVIDTSVQSRDSGSYDIKNRRPNLTLLLSQKGLTIYQNIPTVNTNSPNNRSNSNSSNYQQKWKHRYQGDLIYHSVMSTRDLRCACRIPTPDEWSELDIRACGRNSNCHLATLRVQCQPLLCPSRQLCSNHQLSLTTASSTPLAGNQPPQRYKSFQRRIELFYDTKHSLAWRLRACRPLHPMDLITELGGLALTTTQPIINSANNTNTTTQQNIHSNWLSVTKQLGCYYKQFPGGVTTTPNNSTSHANNSIGGTSNYGNQHHNILNYITEADANSSNVTIEKWLLDDEVKLGLFATKFIDKGDEIVLSTSQMESGKVYYECPSSLLSGVSSKAEPDTNCCPPTNDTVLLNIPLPSPIVGPSSTSAPLPSSTTPHIAVVEFLRYIIHEAIYLPHVLGIVHQLIQLTAQYTTLQRQHQVSTLNEPRAANDSCSTISSILSTFVEYGGPSLLMLSCHCFLLHSDNSMIGDVNNCGCYSSSSLQYNIGQYYLQTNPSTDDILLLIDKSCQLVMDLLSLDKLDSSSATTSEASTNVNKVISCPIDSLGLSLSEIVDNLRNYNTYIRVEHHLDQLHYHLRNIRSQQRTHDLTAEGAAAACANSSVATTSISSSAQYQDILYCRLPPYWYSLTCHDPLRHDDRVFFYHRITGAVQWEMPVYPWESSNQDDSHDIYDYNRASLHPITHEEITQMYVGLNQQYEMKQKNRQIKHTTALRHHYHHHHHHHYNRYLSRRQCRNNNNTATTTANIPLASTSANNHQSPITKKSNNVTKNSNQNLLTSTTHHSSSNQTHNNNKTNINEQPVPGTSSQPQQQSQQHYSHKKSFIHSDKLKKQHFKNKIMQLIGQLLNDYRKSTCTIGRIESEEDYKYLVNKLSDTILTKELRVLHHNCDQLQVSQQVENKTRTYVCTYMKSRGSIYRRLHSTSSNINHSNTNTT